MLDIKTGVEPVDALAIGVVTTPLVGLIVVDLELAALAPTVCARPHASETENSNNPVKTETEARPAQKYLNRVFLLDSLFIREGTIVVSFHDFRPSRLVTQQPSKNRL